MINKIFKRCFLILGQLAIALLLAEVIVRFMFPDFTDNNKYLDLAFARLWNSSLAVDSNSENFSQKFGFHLLPNSVSTQTTSDFTYTCKTNSHGFWTKEAEPRKAGEYRVMLLGDSMFWGIGVEESGRISSIIEEARTPQLSVYNYSVSGYNTVQELLVAQTYLDEVQPDHIILGFFIANDVIPNAVTFIDENGNYKMSAALEEKFKNDIKTQMGFLYHSVFFRVASFYAYLPRVRYQFAAKEDVLDKSYKLISELNELAKKHHAQFSVVVIYPKDGVDGGLAETWSKSRKVGNLTGSYCQSNSIETLDLLKYMNNSEHRRKYFYKDDGHFNKAGNIVVGNAIFQELIKPHLSN